MYVYCPTKVLKAAFVRDLDEQGFTFEDGARVTERARNFGDIMALQRNHTICFCGYTSHVRCSSLKDPVYVKDDRSRNCVRVDYARFVGGEENYVIRGPQDVYIDEERKAIQTAFLTRQPLSAKQHAILREFLASLNEEEQVAE